MVLGSVTAALTAGLVSVAAGAGPADGHLSGPASRPYVIKPGDTVWSIAERIAGPEEDPRPVVDAILRSNGVRAGSLVPGQVLVIPRD
jgi:nucleoid-associated protein YgaU